MDTLTMNKQLEKYEKIRLSITNEANKKFKRSLLIGILLTPVFGLGLIIIAIAFSTRNANMAALSSELKDNLIVEVVKDTLDDAIYNKSAGISLSRVLSTGLFRGYSSYFSEDLLYGTYKNMKYESADLVLNTIIETAGVNGNTVRSEIPMFKGKFISIDLINNKDLVVIVTEKKKNNDSSENTNYKKIMLESMAFNNKFLTVASSEQDAFYVLTPQLQEKMLELETKFRGSINYVFKDGYLYILINDGRDSLEVFPNKKIDEKFYNSIISDITISCAIIDEFSLDATKWTK